MAKKATKRGEKLGEVVGKRRPVFASILLFVGVVLALSILFYAPGQRIFLLSYLEPLLKTTQFAGDNICGRFGATFCVLSYSVVGVASMMFPVYFAWFGALLFRRRARGIGWGELAASAGGILLLAVFAAILQGAVSGKSDFPFIYGWGGALGEEIYASLLQPSLSVFGSALLVGILYAFCLVVVFVDSPVEAAREIVEISKKSPKAALWLVSALWKILIFIPKLLIRLLAPRALPGKGLPDSRTNSEKAVTSADNSDEVPLINLGDDEDLEPSAVPDIASRFGDEEPVARAIEDMDFISNPCVSNASAPEEEEDIKIVDLKPGSESAAPISSASSGKTSNGPLKGGAKDQEKGFVVERIEIEKYSPPKQEKKRGDYVFPSIDLLNPPPEQMENQEDYKERINEIVEKIGEFGINVLPSCASPGPVITRYEVTPASGVRINKISSLEDDIALQLKAKKVRIVAPIPGKGTIGIEVPNRIRNMVCLRDIIESKEWNESKAEIPIALGKSVTGVPTVLDLTKMPHALIAGSTGSGKSVCISTIIASLVYKMTPDDLRFIMVDPKVVEMQIYNSLPHMLVPVVTDPRKVTAALKWLTSEMERRYKIFGAAKVRNISGLNAKILKDKEEAEKAAELDASLTAEERVAAIEAASESADSDSGAEIEIPDKKLPYIVCIIDELNDLMMVAGKEVEAYIVRLTQLARAAGIHLIVATQRPSTDVITGLIKANLPTRIAFRVTSNVDSRTILDHKGAETLIGYGDMLYTTAGSSDPVRAQGAFVSDEEISAVVDALKVNGEPEFAEDVQEQIENAGEDEDSEGGESGLDDGEDPIVAKAISVIKVSGKASTSLLQRKLGIGYGRAARIIDELEDRGLIGPADSVGKREIFMD